MRAWMIANFPSHLPVGTIVGLSGIRFSRPGEDGEEQISRPYDAFVSDQLPRVEALNALTLKLATQVVRDHPGSTTIYS